jgi:hypothetical protein
MYSKGYGRKRSWPNRVTNLRKPGGTENYKENPVKIASVSAGIRKKYLSNTSLQHYHYANQLGKFLVKCSK